MGIALTNVMSHVCHDDDASVDASNLQDEDASAHHEVASALPSDGAAGGAGRQDWKEDDEYKASELVTYTIKI